MDTLVDHIEERRGKFGDAIFIIGGDFNQNDPNKITRIAPDLRVLVTTPTRGNALLDFVITNAGDIATELTGPLESIRGTVSDHKSILSTLHVTQYHEF